jgi:hypothetical protein
MIDGNAPEYQIRELYIDIRSIEVFAVGPDAIGEWIVLDFPGGEYDVFTLANGKVRQIVDQWFPTNKKITKMRLVLGDNCHIITTTVQKIPVEISKEIVVEDIDADLRLHTISSIVIDMNFALIYREESDTFYLEPTTRVFPEIFGWSLRGTVAPAEIHAHIVVEQNGMRLFSSVERNGTFMFLGLPGKEWTVHIFPDPERRFSDTTFVHKIDSTRRINELGSIRLHPIVVEVPDPDPDPEEEE